MFVSFIPHPFFSGFPPKKHAVVTSQLLLLTGRIVYRRSFLLVLVDVFVVTCSDAVRHSPAAGLVPFPHTVVLHKGRSAILVIHRALQELQIIDSESYSFSSHFYLLFVDLGELDFFHVFLR